MSGFQLDTSGQVPLALSPAHVRFYQWGDLSSFAQGYVEALFCETWERDSEGLERPLTHFAGFSDLSPEALAMILDRCVAYEREARDVGLWEGDRTQGEWFWKYQQKLGRDFPLNPLTPVLSEDGKVNLIPQAQVGKV